jgi:hypothetical protein
MLMPVQSASLEVLEKAAVPPAQARAIVQAIEIEMAGARDTLATRQDLLVLGHGLELKIEVLRGDLRSEIQSLHSEFHGMASNIMRQTYAAILGQLAVLLGVSYFFVSHLPR